MLFEKIIKGGCQYTQSNHTSGLNELDMVFSSVLS